MNAYLSEDVRKREQEEDIKHRRVHSLQRKEAAEGLLGEYKDFSEDDEW